jgi:hypothetical protein
MHVITNHYSLPLTPWGCQIKKGTNEPFLLHSYTFKLAHIVFIVSQVRRNQFRLVYLQWERCELV